MNKVWVGFVGIYIYIQSHAFWGDDLLVDICIMSERFIKFYLFIDSFSMCEQ